MKNLFENKKIQSLVMWSFLVVAAVVAFYSLAYASNFWLYDGSNPNWRIAAMAFNEYQGYDTSVDMFPHWVYDVTAPAGKESVRPICDAYVKFTKTLNSTNNYLLVSQVMIIAIFAVMCIMGNRYRKRYYLSNLIAGIACPVISVVLALVGIIKNAQVMAQFEDCKLYLMAIKSFNSVKIHPNLAYQTGMLILLIVEICVFILVTVYSVLKYVYSKKSFAELYGTETEVTTASLTEEAE